MCENFKAVLTSFILPASQYSLSQTTHEWKETVGGRLWRSQCCYQGCALVPIHTLKYILSLCSNLHHFFPLFLSSSVTFCTLMKSFWDVSLHCFWFPLALRCHKQCHCYAQGGKRKEKCVIEWQKKVQMGDAEGNRY